MKTIKLVILIFSIIFIKYGNNLKMAVNIPPFTVNLGRIKMPTIMIALKGGEALNMPAISISASTGHSNDNWYPETYYNHPYRNQPLYDLENWGSNTNKQVKNVDWPLKKNDHRLKGDEEKFKNNQLNNDYSLKKSSYKNYNGHIMQSNVPFKTMSYSNNINNYNLNHRDHSVLSLGQATNPIGQSLNSPINLINHDQQKQQEIVGNVQMLMPSNLPSLQSNPISPLQWDHQKNQGMLAQQTNNETPNNSAEIEENTENLENYKDDDEENEII